jgi:hypothetical protein
VNALIGADVKASQNQAVAEGVLENNKLSSQSQLSITKIEPSAIRNNVDNIVKINGSGFNSQTTIQVGNQYVKLSDAFKPNPQQSAIFIKIPAGFSAGTYRVGVTNLDGGSFFMNSALVVEAPQVYISNSNQLQEENYRQTAPSQSITVSQATQQQAVGPDIKVEEGVENPSDPNSYHFYKITPTEDMVINAITIAGSDKRNSWMNIKMSAFDGGMVVFNADFLECSSATYGGYGQAVPYSCPGKEVKTSQERSNARIWGYTASEFEWSQTATRRKYSLKLEKGKMYVLSLSPYQALHHIRFTTNSGQVLDKIFNFSFKKLAQAHCSIEGGSKDLPNRKSTLSCYSDYLIKEIVLRIGQVSITPFDYRIIVRNEMQNIIVDKTIVSRVRESRDYSVSDTILVNSNEKKRLEFNIETFSGASSGSSEINMLPEIKSITILDDSQGLLLDSCFSGLCQNTLRY